MNRVALLMSGQLRQSWLSAPSLNKCVVEPNNADIFLFVKKDSFTPQVDNTEEVVRKVFNKNVKSLIFSDANYDKEVKGLIESNYTKIDNHYKKLGRDNWDKTLNVHNSDQYAQLKRCAESAVKYANRNNFKYDLMVRVRPNHGWLNKLDLSLPVLQDTLYVNYSEHNVGYADKIQNVPWVEDTLFFGSQDVMLKLCSDFSEKMVDELEICDERYDLSCATEKLLARVLINSGIKYTGINDYFGYKGKGWIRPKLDKFFVDWKKSENYHLVEKFCAGINPKNNSSLAVYFDKVGEKNIIFDETIVK